MLTDLFIQSFAHGFACSLIAIVYALVLKNEDIPGLNKWYDLLDQMQYKGKYMKLLAKPLGACECCFAGHLALWTSLWFSGWAHDQLSIHSHFTAAAMAIVSTHFIGELYKWKAQ